MDLRTWLVFSALLLVNIESLENEGELKKLMGDFINSFTVACFFIYAYIY